MKQITIPFLLSLIFTSSLYSQALDELEKQIASRNNIKTKIRYDHKYSEGTAAKSGTKSSATTYNSSGDVLYIEIYNPKGAVTGTEKYAYDGNDNRILFERTGNSKYKKESKYNANSQLLYEKGFNGAEEFRNDYSYNAAGKVTEIIYTISGHTSQKIVYKYSGTVANVEVYARGNTLSSRMKMVYDENDNLVEETTLSVDGKELEKKSYSFNSNSQMTEEIKTTNGKLYYHIWYTYDKLGRLIAVAEETLSKKKYIKKEYLYDGEGNLIAYKWRRNPDEEFNIKSYTYNEKGVCLSEHTYYPKTKFELLSRFEYAYY